MRIFTGVVQEWEGAQHGQRGAVLEARLPLLGMSLGTFHRERERRFGETGRQTPKTKGVPKRPEYLEAVQAIIKEKYHPKKGVRPLTTADAQAEAAAKGCALAASIPEGTVNRLARELQLHPRVQRREARFEASQPNELHQMDASRSEYFQCHRHRGGEWVLKLSPTIFKNRDYRELRERVWIWGLVDDFSGFRVLRYCVAKGESAEDGISFLQWTWSKVEAHAPFRGLPGTLYLDQGPLNKTKAFQHFCAEVAGVRLLAHEAGRPQATGKVESGWKTLWRRFEARFFRDPGCERREFSLADLNQELAWYLQEHNRTEHRRLKHLSKEEAWLTIQGVVDIDPGAWGHIFHREHRTLDAAGCFDFRGEPWQVKEMPYPGGVRAEVYLGVRDGAVLVADPRDGRKYAAAPFAAAPAGEYRRGELTPLERLQQEAPDGDAGARPITFAPQAESNVVHLVRQAQVRESGFEMPGGATAHKELVGSAHPTLEEMAAGVELIDRSTDRSTDQEKLFATPLERYEAIVAAQARGKPATQADGGFLTWFRGEYAEMLNLLSAPRVRLAVVE